MEIREAMASDAEQMLELFIKLDRETTFMLMEPEERKTSVEQQTQTIASFAQSKDKMMAIAIEAGTICGFILASGGTAIRNRHSAYMVLGVQKTSWGKGVGSALIEFMEQWAVSASIHRIEFTVIEKNVAARALYRKFGYREEGIKRDSLKINGAYVNEIYMGKIFEAEQA